ncbi:hypothetical protein DENSPDRAFT_851415 [Dentipellis sp. KUC8613]|nr:hypothetical protein DENSPDRAFT_851415 [Dentipellis sp. KUC8613]
MHEVHDKDVRPAAARARAGHGKAVKRAGRRWMLQTHNGHERLHGGITKAVGACGSDAGICGGSAGTCKHGVQGQRLLARVVGVCKIVWRTHAGAEEWRAGPRGHGAARDSDEGYVTAEDGRREASSSSQGRWGVRDGVADTRMQETVMGRGPAADGRRRLGHETTWRACEGGRGVRWRGGQGKQRGQRGQQGQQGSRWARWREQGARGAKARERRKRGKTMDNGRDAHDDARRTDRSSAKTHGYQSRANGGEAGDGRHGRARAARTRREQRQSTRPRGRNDEGVRQWRDDSARGHTESVRGVKRRGHDDECETGDDERAQAVQTHTSTRRARTGRETGANRARDRREQGARQARTGREKGANRARDRREQGASGGARGRKRGARRRGKSGRAKSSVIMPAATG